MFTCCGSIDLRNCIFFLIFKALFSYLIEFINTAPDLVTRRIFPLGKLILDIPWKPDK